MNCAQLKLSILLLSSVSAVFLCFVFGTQLAFAQTIAEDADGIASATTTATTSLEVAEPTVDESWYRTIRITGQVEGMNDFVVGPGKAELELDPGETRVIEVQVTNRIDDDRSFKIEIEDAVGTADGSRAIRLLGSARGPYSIKDFVSVPNDEFAIDFGERAYIPVTISIPPNTEPGGYYGSVLVQTVHRPDDEDAVAQVAPRSPVISRIGSLFFIRVTGDRDEGGELAEFNIVNDQLWYESGPFTFGVTYENTGTVHQNPYGEISITNMFGEEIDFIELEPSFILPKSLRLREIEWDRELLLGRYTATLRLNRGYDDIVDEATVHFWVLPWKITLSIFGAVFVVLFLIRLFFKTFEFKKR